MAEEKLHDETSSAADAARAADTEDVVEETTNDATVTAVAEGESADEGAAAVEDAAETTDADADATSETESAEDKDNKDKVDSADGSDADDAAAQTAADVKSDDEPADDDSDEGDVDDDDLDLPMEDIEALLNADASDRKNMNAQMRRVAAREAESRRRVEDAVKSTKANPRWFVPLFCAFLVIGLIWAVVFYLTNKYPIPAIGRWNLLVAFAIMMVGFLMTVAWH